MWEPWPTRTLQSVKGTKILQTAEGIYNNINFVYMNRGWIEQNKATAEKFILSLVQANDLIEKDRPAAAKMVAKFLKMPLDLATELMPKVEFDMDLDAALDRIDPGRRSRPLADQKKLKAPLDYTKYVYIGPAEERPAGERQADDPSGKEVATAAAAGATRRNERVGLRRPVERRPSVVLDGVQEVLHRRVEGGRLLEIHGVAASWAARARRERGTCLLEMHREAVRRTRPRRR